MSEELNASSVYNDEKTVICSFCHEHFPSSTVMRKHLMLCGNKTDPCPNCKKFIRRAIFAYHFENGCTNLDDIIDSDEAKSNSINTRNKNRESEVIAILKTIRCEFCNENCDQDDYELHKDKCMDNPKNSRNKQRQPDITNPHPKRSIISQNNTDDDVDLIPCQFCNESIKSYNYVGHQVACKDQQKFLEERKRHNDRKSIGSVSCQYCYAVHNNIEALRVHQRNCPEDSRNRSYAEVVAGESRTFPSD